jgi:CheY-like chemotaxis protein
MEQDLQSQAGEARILLVDDSAEMRRSLRVLLEAQENWKVCDEASDGREAIAKYDRAKFTWKSSELLPACTSGPSSMNVTRRKLIP